MTTFATGTKIPNDELSFTSMIKNKLLILWSFAILFPGIIKGQAHKQESELLAYNIGFGVLSTTIGALINKPKGKNTWDCIKNSIWQGAVGGTLQYTGKKLTYEVNRNQNYAWGWPSKLVHSAGASICQNAAMGNSFGQYWVIDYAALRCNFTVKKGRVNVQPQFNLLFVFDLAAGLSIGHIDWEKSLQTGAFTFYSNTDYLGSLEGKPALGKAYTRSIIYAKYSYENIHKTVAHELVHTYQSNEYRVMNTYFDPLKAKIKNKTINDIFKYVYVELPYFAGFYGLNYNRDCHYRNFYEFEAEYFSTNSYVDRGLK